MNFDELVQRRVIEPCVVPPRGDRRPTTGGRERHLHRREPSRYRPWLGLRGRIQRHSPELRGLHGEPGFQTAFPQQATSRPA